MSPALLERLRRAAPWVADLALLLLAAGPVLGTTFARAPHGQEPRDVVLGLVALGSILLRRRQPLAALGVTAVVGALLPEIGSAVIPALVILYTIASRRPWPFPAAPAAAVVAADIVGYLASSHPGHVADAIGVAVECAAAVALGLYVGARRTSGAALRDRADLADRERKLLAERAVAGERLRIAQDLHDVVAHNVSLMVVAAQALGATVDDERVVGGTDAIADLGRAAMTEMHRTLRLLRADDEAALRAPQPNLSNLDKLIEQTRASGMEVELTVEGEPRPLTQTVELSVFRIVQEALTNVIKHAGRAHTVVTVGYRTNGLELRITDSGRGRLAAPGASPTGEDGTPRSGGHGVIGMRERAAAFGGTLTALPRLDHGFEVTAMLPYTDAGA
jgi:signal transduction histidine kinase